MENIIGKAIGIVEHTFSITNDHKDKVQLSVKIDFSTASDTDIKAWLVSNRVIAGQRSWRALSKAELEDMKGTTFIAQHIGRKMKSKAERVQEFMAVHGVNEKQALYAIDNPEKWQAIMDQAMGMMETETETEETIEEDDNN